MLHSERDWLQDRSMQAKCLGSLTRALISLQSW